MDPPPRSSKYGIPYLQHRKTLLRFTSCTCCQASSSVSRIESSSGGEMPALLKSTSSPPKRSEASLYIPCTSSGFVTSAWMYRPSISLAVSSPGSSARSTTHKRAPSSAKRFAVSRPMPLAPPVMTATFPSRRPGMSALLRGDVDVLYLGVVVEGVRPELAPDARLLHPAEGCGDADGGVGVYGDDARLHAPGDAQGAGAVLSPDRAREAVDRVVRLPYRILLVIEGDHRHDGAEDLLPRRPVLVGERREDRRRIPEATPFGSLTLYRHGGILGDVRRDGFFVLGGDERAHVCRLVEWVPDAEALDCRLHEGEEVVEDAPLDEDARAGAEQSCPALPKTAAGASLAAFSRSASAKTTFADLPPSSRVTRFMVPAAPWAILLPTSVDPVKAIFATSGFSTRRCPTLLPGPTTTFTTPSGIPASLAMRSNSTAVRGVSPAGLRTRVFPAASAGAIFQLAIVSGKFHGTMSPTTPSGSLKVTSTPPETGMLSPSNLSGIPA